MRFILFSFLLMTNMVAWCQIDIVYSAEERLERQLESGETKMLGENRQYVYVMMLGYYNLTANAKKLVAYNQEDMSKAFECNLNGFKETNISPESAEILGRGILLNSIVLEEQVVFFWGTKGAVYAFTFDEKLMEVGVPKLVIDLQEAMNRNTSNSESPEVFQSTTTAYFALTNDSTRMFAVGAEVFKQIGEPIQIYYALYDYDMNMIAGGNAEAPIMKGSNLETLSSQYILGNDNNIYFVSVMNPVMVGVDQYYYNFLTGQVDTDDQAINYIENKQDGYILSELTLVNANENVAVVGFYCDMKFDSKGRSNHGIYLLSVEQSTGLVAENAQYVAFSEEQNHQMEFEVKKGLSPQQTGWDKFRQSTLKVLDVDRLKDHSFLLTLSTNKNFRGFISGKSFAICRYVYLLKLNDRGEIVWISGSDAKSKYNAYVYTGNTTISDNDAITHISGKGVLLSTDLNSGDFVRMELAVDKEIRYVYSGSNMYSECRQSTQDGAYKFGKLSIAK